MLLSEEDLELLAKMFLKLRRKESTLPKCAKEKCRGYKDVKRLQFLDLSIHIYICIYIYGSALIYSFLFVTTVIS